MLVLVLIVVNEISPRYIVSTLSRCVVVRTLVFVSRDCLSGAQCFLLRLSGRLP